MSAAAPESSEEEEEEDESHRKRIKKTPTAAIRKPPSSTEVRQQKFKPFIPAAYEMVQDEANADAIRFSEDGTQVEIRDIAKFSDVVLPKYFKHKNLSSFIRQLNMYGFIKCDAVGESKHTFMHEYFQRDHRELIGKIERKSVKAKKHEHIANPSAMEGGGMGKELNMVESTYQAAEDLKKLKQIQLAHEERIKQLEQENHHLTEENERIRSAITQVKGAQSAMTDRLRQLFLYFLKFYVKDGQLSEGDLRTLMNGGGVLGQGGLEDEQQRVVNSFLQLQNGSKADSAASASVMNAMATPPPTTTTTTTTTAAPMVTTAPLDGLVRTTSNDDYSKLFLEDEDDDMGNILLGRSHSLASNNSFLTGGRSDTLGKSSAYHSFSKDLGEHLQRNDDTMKRIDTLTSALLLPSSTSKMATTTTGGTAVDLTDAAFNFENAYGEDQEEEEEEVLTRS
ncbi:hypothetical protein BASA81_006561 [Batrachochytrium salamandrivorans]|nr:hypothetical protein BASA81_006561 [Batrachochytrium salamandrivorans]